MTANGAVGAASGLVAKHLPPSASSLRLLDLDGTLSPGLIALRPDLAVTVGTPDQSTYDAVVAYDACAGRRLAAPGFARCCDRAAD